MPSRARRFAIGTNVLLSTALLAAVLVAVNVLAARHARTWDWTGAGEFTLSEKTRGILKGLREAREHDGTEPPPVEIANFIPESARGRGEVDLGRRIRNLLKGYETEGRGRIVVHQPRTEEDLLRLKQADFPVPGPQSDVPVVVKRGERVEKIAQTRLAKVSATDGRVEQFTAEAALTAAIKSILENARRQAAFLVGHGEIASRDPRISEIRRLLADENVDVTDVNLLDGGLAGMDLAVVAGPSAPYAPEEAAQVESYLRGGGRLLFLMEPHLRPERKGLLPTGLEHLLESWKVKLGDALALDPAQPDNPTLLLYRGGRMLLGGSPETFPTGFNPQHPITATLHQWTQVGPILPNNLLFHTVRPVESLEQHPRETTVLIQSPPSALAVYDLSVAELDESSATKRGPFPIAVAVEREREGKKTRLAVFGDLSFIEDEIVRRYPFNKDLFANAVNWLLEQEDALGIGPKSASELLHMRLGTEAARKWVWKTAFLFLPGGALLVALAVWLMRRA